MRVAVATSFPDDPDRPHGGVEAVSVNLVRALSKRTDCEVHVVTVRRECESYVERLWQGAVIHRLPWLGGRTLTNAVGRGRRQLQERLIEMAPEVVHAHDTYGLMVKGLNLPRVFTVHGFIHADTRLSGSKWAGLRSRLWRRVEKAGWADQQHIIAISPYVRRELEKTVKGQIYDIENPVSEAFFGIERNEGSATVFCAAVICPRKNTLGLLEAVARLVTAGVDVRLRLAGAAADRAYASEVRDLIQTSPLNGRVALLGTLSSEQVRQELAAASVFALVSLEENSPMCIEEAMAAGVPVVTSNRCGMPYMVQDGHTGFLVDPTKPDEISQRLRRLLEEDALRQEMGMASRQAARERFHPDGVAARTYEVYRKAIDGFGGHGGKVGAGEAG